MAGALLLASLPVWLFRELPRARALAAERIGLRATLGRIVSPAERRFVAVLVLYRAGGSLASAMLRPWLVDSGHSLAQIGWLLGTLGFVASLLGALLGGVIVSRVSRRAGLVSFALLHAVTLLGYAACARSAQQAFLPAALALEHLLDGMATAALFTTMMDHTRPESAATDYTAQASLVAGAAGLFGLPSGLLAQAVGYPAHFALAAALTAVAAAVAFRSMRVPFQGFDRARYDVDS
jgi:predicted MFS family arabinose efflux permease